MAERAGELLRGLLGDIGRKHPDALHIQYLIGQNESYLQKQSKTTPVLSRETAIATIPVPPYKDILKLRPGLLPYSRELNVLHDPLSASEWNILLGNGMGENLSALLDHLVNAKKLLSMKPARRTLDSDVRNAFKGVGIEVNGVNIVSLEGVRKIAPDVVAAWTYPPRRGSEVSSYIYRLIEGNKRLDHVTYPYFEVYDNPERSVRVSSYFFEHLFSSGIERRFDASTVDVGRLPWDSLRTSIHSEADLIASGNLDAAAKFRPFREMCFEGNYPLGLNDRDRAVVLVA